MTHSPEIDKLAAAILQVQKSVKPVKCNAVGSDGKPYADIAAVRAALRPLLNRHKLVVIQSGIVSVEMKIIHTESSQWVEMVAETVPLNADGGHVLYGHRHALMQAFAMVQEPDQKPNALAALGPVGAGLLPARVMEAFDRCGLNYAQGLVIMKSGKSADEMIAEAERIGGRK